MKFFHITVCIFLLICFAGCSISEPIHIDLKDSELELTISDFTSPSDLEDPLAPTDETDPHIEETEPPIAETEPPMPETEPFTEPADEDFVRITDYIPDAVIDLKYATTDNFTGQVIYEFQDGWLRYGTVKKLMQASQQLNAQGYKIKIWDAFRPISAQFTLWEICPDATYVANPHNGFSSHSRGNTVDITLVYADGGPVQMPTGFDDFSTLADRDYSDCDLLAAENARLLQAIMEDCGFRGYWGEWWHFSDTVTYAPGEDFDPVLQE